MILNIARPSGNVELESSLHPVWARDWLLLYLYCFFFVRILSNFIASWAATDRFKNALVAATKSGNLCRNQNLRRNQYSAAQHDRMARWSSKVWRFAEFPLRTSFELTADVFCICLWILSNVSCTDSVEVCQRCRCFVYVALCKVPGKRWSIFWRSTRITIESWHKNWKKVRAPSALYFNLFEFLWTFPIFRTTPLYWRQKKNPEKLGFLFPLQCVLRDPVTVPNLMVMDVRLSENGNFSRNSSWHALSHREYNMYLMLHLIQKNYQISQKSRRILSHGEHASWMSHCTGYVLLPVVKRMKRVF